MPLLVKDLFMSADDILGIFNTNSHHQNLNPIKFSTSHQDMNIYSKLTEQTLNLLKNIEFSNDTQLKNKFHAAIKIYNRIETRRLYRYIGGSIFYKTEALVGRKVTSDEILVKVYENLKAEENEEFLGFLTEKSGQNNLRLGFWRSKFEATISQNPQDFSKVLSKSRPKSQLSPHKNASTLTTPTPPTTFHLLNSKTFFSKILKSPKINTTTALALKIL